MLKKFWHWLIDKQPCGCNWLMACEECSVRLSEIDDLMREAERKEGRSDSSLRH